MLIVGMLAYVPAMTMPVMLTRSFSGPTSDTIISGVLALIDDGSVGIAMVIFVASVCIPAIKFVVIAGLALSLHFKWSMSRHTRHRLHKVTEFIGRWSMIDVFVVAILTALIQLGSFMTVLPGAGINAFTLSVVFTMLAATSLDPRLFWDDVNHVTSKPG